MRVVIRRWGNSLALRIPGGMAADAALHDESEVDIALEAGRLVVEPVAVPELSLDALLARVTPENVHREQDVGPPRGAEAW